MWWQWLFVAGSNDLLQTAHTLIKQSLYWVEFFHALIPILYRLSYKLDLEPQLETNALSIIDTVSKKVSASMNQGKPDDAAIRAIWSGITDFDTKEIQEVGNMHHESLRNLGETLALLLRVTRMYISSWTTRKKALTHWSRTSPERHICDQNQ